MSAAGRPLVLYVEDDEDLRELTALLLEADFDLVVCASGAEALAIAVALTPDLLLLDVIMPDLDGPTTLARLRALPHLAAVPVVFLTGRARPEDEAQLRALGAADVVAKPMDAATLVPRLLVAMRGDG